MKVRIYKQSGKGIEISDVSVIEVELDREHSVSFANEMHPFDGDGDSVRIKLGSRYRLFVLRDEDQPDPRPPGAPIA